MATHAIKQAADRPPQSATVAAGAKAVFKVSVVVTLSRGYGRNILKGILDHAETHGRWEFDVLGKWMEAPDLATLGGSDGIIAEAREPEKRAALAGLGRPVVTVTGEDVSDGLASVVADSRAVGVMAADHLLELGLTDLAFGPGRQTHATLIARRRGFAERIAERGGVFHDCRFSSDAKVEGWLAALPKPVGVFAMSDMEARGLAAMCRHQGLMVPEQVAILGVDNEEIFCRMAHPPLSSIDQNARRLGSEAGVLMDRLLAHKPVASETVVVPPVGVIVRQSTDTLAIDRPDVAAAVRLIRQRFFEPITTRDIVAEIPVSRRTLENAFRKTVGRTIGEEIRRLRIERAKFLMATTTRSMAEVCLDCGISYPSKLSHIFRQHTGMSPTAYRKRHQR